MRLRFQYAKQFIILLFIIVLFVPVLLLLLFHILAYDLSHGNDS